MPKSTEPQRSEVYEFKTPSFGTRLNIQDFAFKPNPAGASISPRRSPRINSGSESPNVNILHVKRSSSSLDSESSPKKKKARSPAGYAPPSTYAHLPLLPDVLEPNLICAFVGLNPGIQTARDGHAYAHPSNLFWKLLHSSGLTTRRLSPEEDQNLPELFSLGYTNIVSRPTRNGSELSKDEMDASVEILEEKVRTFRPEAVCIVGKSIWESIWRVRHGRAIKKNEFKYGWQDKMENMGCNPSGANEDGWRGARVFAATSTSGLAAAPPVAEKERIWRELGAWVARRRAERVEAAEQDRRTENRERRLSN
jgi:G:T/U-mismatch repair DNA glycosylase